MRKFVRLLISLGKWVNLLYSKFKMRKFVRLPISLGKLVNLLRAKFKSVNWVRLEGLVIDKVDWVIDVKCKQYARFLLIHLPTPKY